MNIKILITFSLSVIFFPFLFSMMQSFLFQQPIIENVLSHLIDSPQKIEKTVKDIKSLASVNKNGATSMSSPQTTHTLIYSLAQAHTIHHLEAATALNTYASKQWFDHYETQLNRKLKEKPSIHDIPAWVTLMRAKLSMRPVKKRKNKYGEEVLCKTFYIANEIDNKLIYFLNYYSTNDPLKVDLFKRPHKDKKFALDLFIKASSEDSYTLLSRENSYKKVIKDIIKDWKKVAHSHYPLHPFITTHQALSQSDIVLYNSQAAFGHAKYGATSHLFPLLMTKLLCDPEKQQFSLSFTFDLPYIGMDTPLYKKFSKIFDLPE